jgi:hypothetical protein
LSRVIKSLIVFYFATYAPILLADNGCEPSLAALAGGSDNPGASREELVKEMARFFSAALQDRSHAAAFDHKLRAMAETLGEPVEALSKEIEALAESPVAQRQMREEREAKREEEKARLYLGLEPYLDRISEAHRRVIERELIDRGSVKPLVTGEVEFSFLGPHRVMVGDEDFWGDGQGQLKEVVFVPEDSFTLGQVPVTQLMYFLAALGSGVEPTPSEFKEGEGSVALNLDGREYRMKPNHPVEWVNFDEALAHAARVSEILGGSYGLPSETKWEFANRAGSSDMYHFGNDVALLPKYGWFNQNSGRQTQAVGELRPNGYGLYDTHGNVVEWTSSKVNGRVIRGGSWADGGKYLRSGDRGSVEPGRRSGALGFRLERTGLSKIQPSYTFTLGEPEPEAKPGLSKTQPSYSFTLGNPEPEANPSPVEVSVPPSPMDSIQVPNPPQPPSLIRRFLKRWRFPKN